ncbi:MAG TPA: ABC transporter permease [Methylomirabilota bacterium]|jgi:ABC-2 type transport system permease protein|nr:ABC transporter permease [Methylomirabilota bacterium]
MNGLLLPVLTLWKREVVRFLRQRSRVMSALSTPLVFWLLLGSGFRASFRPPGAPEGTGYLEYLYPGIIVLVILFTAIFSTISIIEDRKAGFLQGVLVAPVSRASIVMGQALGGSTLALLQGGLFLFLAPVAGIPLSLTAILAVIAVMALVAFALTSIGLTIAWRMRSIQGFHAIMNLILMPVWFLSGAFFPAAGLPSWLACLMRLNPLMYGMAALRSCFYLGNPAIAGQLPPVMPSLLVTTLFAGGSFLLATATAQRQAE